ncbi:hypothetical protein LMH87_001064 [Akanthomyces muscarius]|uniref:Sulfatase N-terminal domain-containing protein n=1 Tax=Akanthomyces muscarius TaxID=2231603 RepID=A0A9W8ULP5_AKAMU|nr:hypothetical protein LMH87_001064 [Akanthomyces muscarius]KAJ4155838.1 hypothetical protein LMH87_001064 [Akanthomyces muscarius]
MLGQLRGPCLRILTIIGIVASRFFNTRFVYSIAAVSTLAAKAIHIRAHQSAFRTADLFLWGPTFFFQDAILLLGLRWICDLKLARWRLYEVCQLLAAGVSLGLLVLATVNISFYSIAGTELHWRNVGFVGGESSRKVVLSGAFRALVVGAVLVATSFFLQDFCSALARIVLRIIGTAATFALQKSGLSKILRMYNKDIYTKLEQDDLNDSDGFGHQTSYGQSSFEDRLYRSPGWKYVFAFFASLIVYQIILVLLRPPEPSFIFMSWAVPALPIIDVTHASSALGVLLPVFGTGMHFEWDDGTTALTAATPFSWLPNGTSQQGFEDWYEGEEHYSPDNDPLHISNMDDDLLPELQGALDDVNIRHILLVKLESTRKDVFPFKKDGFIWEQLAKTFPEGKLPEHILERLGTLTPTANRMTGDYDDGFQHSQNSPRGGLSFDNAFTTASYTRKSFTGTLCGVTPLVADFNVEFENHIYQPCLPQILNVFNKITEKNDTDYTTYPWKTYMMQSITDSFDKAHEQLPEMGYAEENIITKEYLKGDSPKFGYVDLPDINYYGMAEVAIEDYIRDAFSNAKRDNERVLLTHITSTTHHPFEIPEEEKYVALSEDSNLNDLSHYLNAVGYVDRWMGKILGILDEQGVANETLVVAVGDHGLSIAENHGVTAYLNPNVANFHVPLVLSHPQLPALRSDAAVQSLQILPTILDLLRETNSLSDETSQAAEDLLGIYEGQSLIRPVHAESEESGYADWQFTVMNPGKATLSVRSARDPAWRIVVPIVEDVEWRFTNLEESPNETEEIVIFGFVSFLNAVKDRHGKDAAEWAEEAAFMARWWVDENRRRYRYSE